MPEHASVGPGHDVGLPIPVPVRVAGAAREDADRLARADFQGSTRPLADTYQAGRTGAFRRGAGLAWHVTFDRAVPAEAASASGALGASAQAGPHSALRHLGIDEAVAGGQPGLAGARFAALAAGGADVTRGTRRTGLPVRAAGLPRVACPADAGAGAAPPADALARDARLAGGAIGVGAAGAALARPAAADAARAALPVVLAGDAGVAGADRRRVGALRVGAAGPDPALSVATDFSGIALRRVLARRAGVVAADLPVRALRIGAAIATQAFAAAADFPAAALPVGAAADAGVVVADRLVRCGAVVVAAAGSCKA